MAEQGYAQSVFFSKKIVVVVVVCVWYRFLVVFGDHLLRVCCRRYGWCVLSSVVVVCVYPVLCVILWAGI